MYNTVISTVYDWIQHLCSTCSTTLDVPLLITNSAAAVRVCVRVHVMGGTNLVHSSNDWTSICWKVLISSRFPRIRATSELLSLEEKVMVRNGKMVTTCSVTRKRNKIDLCCLGSVWKYDRYKFLLHDNRSVLTFFKETILVNVLKRSQIVCQEALEVLWIFCLSL